MSILVEDVLLDGKSTNIYVEDGLINCLGEKVEAEYVLDAKGKAAIPGYVNTHTHAAMTLFRGYADDLSLHKWLNEHIWPVEAKLTEEDVYWGTRLACLEMIKSGTTCFNDMYWHLEGAVKAVEDSGLRAVLSSVFIDAFNQETGAKQRRDAKKQLKMKTSERITLALGPHAVYTVTEESLMWVKDLSDKKNTLIHMHLCETEKEVQDCLKQKGKRPLEYLDKIGFLGPNLVAAHCVHLSSGEIGLLGENEVKVSHCPVSNMKLGVGGALRYRDMVAEGVCVSLGTDGCASNNNLDMSESMKVAALLAKARSDSPTVLPAGEAYEMATVKGCEALGIDAGWLKEGRIADIALVDLSRAELCPGHNLKSDLVYSANGSCIDTVICDGRLLMKDGVVDGERELIEKMREVASDVFTRE